MLSVRVGFWQGCSIFFLLPVLSNCEQGKSEVGGWKTDGRGQRTTFLIVDCGFKNKVEDRDSLVGAAFSHVLAI